MKTLEETYQELTKRLPKFLDIYASQEGEDALLRRLLKSRYYQQGIYVDVGALHPLRFSNTAHYYMKGWWGINLEPSKQIIEHFDEIRPRDINLNIAVGNEGESEFFVFKEPAFNTFDATHLEFALTKSELVDRVQVKKYPLNWILQKHLSEEHLKKLVFFTIDVEGTELEVLQTNDWKIYRPLMLLVEALSDSKHKEISRYLSGVGYYFVARTKNTYFFAESNFKREFVD